MNIEYTAYLVTKSLCKAHKARNNADYPVIYTDPAWAMHSACNRELDTLIAIDSRACANGFNRAFHEAFGYHLGGTRNV